MAINPDNITTIRVDQLNSVGLTLESLFPHTNGTELTSSSIGDLATLVATTIESLNGIGFLPISVTDGQQLPDLPENPVFFLAGAGTYLNVNGFPDLICTENLNAIMSVTDHWEIAVEIPVNPLTGSVQSVTGSAVDNTDPLNPVINLSSAVTSVNGLTGIVVVDGTNIDVTDPTTSTDATLNDALANIYASGGTPDLQAVTDIGNTIADGTDTNTVSASGLVLTRSDLTNDIFTEITPTSITLTDNNTSNQASVSLNSYTLVTADGTIIIYPDKININSIDYPLPTGISSQIATLADITGGGYTVVNSNLTAVNDTNYTVVANATFTDPTPTEGKGYVVYVRNGTATIGGTGYAVGSLIFRVFHSGSWSTREYKSNLTLDTTPTNGSTNGVESNGVFDALALKADKYTTRQIIRSKNNGTFGIHTLNTAETVLFTIPISGGEFEIGDWMDFIFQFERLVTGTNITVRFRAGTNGNTSDALIAALAMASTTLDSAIKRERFEFNTGNILKGMNNSSTATVNDIANIASARTSTSLNPANNWILTVTAALGSSGDTILCTGYQIGKTKTF